MHQFARIDAQASRQLEQIVEVEVASAALDLTKESSVNTAASRQGFLTEAQGFAASTDAFAKNAGGRGDWLWHSRPNPICPDYLCPERLCPMSLRPNHPYPDSVPIHAC